MKLIDRVSKSLKTTTKDESKVVQQAFAKAVKQGGDSSPRNKSN